MLTRQQLEAREGRLTASRVACLMRGDDAAILDLWREMVGDPEYKPKDLSGIWAIQLGETTETLNLDWYERKQQRPVSRRGEVVIHHRVDWAACTLDGFDDELPGPVEAKHVGGREALATIVDRYQSQIHWLMLVTGSRQAALSVIEGASEPIVEIIPRDEEYAAELWRRAEAFMACVWSFTPPVAGEVVLAPVLAVKTYDFAGNNEWGSEAAAWLETRAARKRNEVAEKAIKGLVPADAKRAHGNGIEVARNRAGALTIREMTA